MSFLLSRTNTFSRFITREHSFSDSKVIDNLYKLEKVNNDNELFLTVVNINENKFIKQALQNDCFYFVGDHDLIIRDSYLLSSLSTVTFYRSQISCNEAKHFLKNQLPHKSMVKITKQIFINQKMEMVKDIISKKDDRATLITFFSYFLQSNKPSDLDYRKINEFIKTMPEILHHLKIDQICRLVEDIFTFYGFVWNHELHDSIVDQALALTCYWDPNEKELELLFSEIRSIIDEILVDDLIWATTDDLCELVKSNLINYQIPYSKLFSYIFNLLDQSQLSVFTTNQLP